MKSLRNKKRTTQNRLSLKVPKSKIVTILLKRIQLVKVLVHPLSLQHLIKKWVSLQWINRAMTRKSYRALKVLNGLLPLRIQIHKEVRSPQMKMMGTLRTLRKLRRITMTKKRRRAVKMTKNQSLKKMMSLMTQSHSQMKQLSQWTITTRKQIGSQMSSWSYSQMKLDKIKNCSSQRNQMRKISRINSHSILSRRKKKLLSHQNLKYSPKQKRKRQKLKRNHRRI